MVCGDFRWFVKGCGGLWKVVVIYLVVCYGS